MCHSCLALPAVIIADGWRVVGRTIVNEYHFHVVDVLCKHAVDTMPERALNVVNGDDDGQSRGHDASVDW